MQIFQHADDLYEVVTCGGLRRVVVTSARIVVQRTGRLGAFVQRLVGFAEATATRIEVTIRRLTEAEIGRLLPHLSIEQGIGARLISRIVRRFGREQALRLLLALASDPVPLGVPS